MLDEPFNDKIYSILTGDRLEGAGDIADPTNDTVKKERDEAEANKESTSKDPQSITKGSGSFDSHPESVSNLKRSKSRSATNFTCRQSISDLEVCAHCDLPRLRYPRIGLNSRVPPDVNATYCANEPPIVLAGHDVHGNAFPGFKPKANATAANNAASMVALVSKNFKGKSSQSKADKKAAAAAAAADDASSGNSSDTAATPSAPSNSFEYPTIKTPQMKCPNRCGQWKAVNVMAKHLDVCLLGRGRKAGREARERIGASNSTPGDSRAGTPRLGGVSNGTKRAREADVDADPDRDREREKAGTSKLGQPKKQKRGK